MLRPALLLLLPAFCIGSLDSLTHEELAMALMQRLADGEPGGWALPCIPLNLPKSRRSWHRSISSGKFMEALEATWLQGNGRVNVSEAMRNEWGTPGNAEFLWQFPRKEFNDYFKRVFVGIRECHAYHGHSLSLDRYDLFHGHSFSFTHDNTTDFGIVFHAKEYPGDLPTGQVGKRAGSNFNTTHPSYHLRNIVWVASRSQSFLIDGSVAELKRLFLPSWLALGIADWMDEIYLQFDKALTLQDSFFSENGNNADLGSINYFTSTDLHLFKSPGCPRNRLYFA